MDLTLIRKLVRMMARSELTELEIEDEKDGLRVRMKRGPEVPASAGPVVHVSPGASVGTPMVMGTGATGMPSIAVAPAGEEGEEREHPPGTEPFPCPMVGTFYRAASPDAEPFVEVGSTVDEDSVVCIVEAMKVMNEIKAEQRGEIVEILVENGEPVEFGQPLFLIKKT